VCIPAGFAFNAEALEGFVSAKNVFDGACHHVVNAWHTIGRGRAFVEHPGLAFWPRRNAPLEDLLFVPLLQYFTCHFWQVKLFIFRIFHRHCVLFF
jgi:hypothetical protein